MTTRRGLKYSIQKNGGQHRSRNDPTKREKKAQNSSETEITQGCAISQRQFTEIPIIPEPELELRMSHSNRDKSYSEGSHRPINEPLQAVLHSLQRKRLGNAATEPPRSNELLEHPQEILER
ncbi:hypothetical protein O181_070805 [Austropuccinia psidii MF-1]|uniref:Uncharacterized protein n=1 Tax=Austropuccinia psidii MF-1 TaxID=1389203 RepID=A0A9Q3EX91_9BASI|nr:hypothetical protein [Austropuccinia psidii MF-1]